MKYIGRLPKTEEYGPHSVAAERTNFRVVKLYGLNLGNGNTELNSKFRCYVKKQLSKLAALK